MIFFRTVVSHGLQVKEEVVPSKHVPVYSIYSVYALKRADIFIDRHLIEQTFLLQGFH